MARPNNSNAIHAAEVKNLGVGRSTMKIAPCKNSNATIAERITLHAVLRRARAGSSE